MTDYVPSYLVPADFSESSVADAEVVGDFMFDDVLDFLNHLLIRMIAHFDGLLKDGDLIRQNHVVPSATMGKRNSLIKPVKVLTSFDTQVIQHFLAGPVFDHDINVMQAFFQEARQRLMKQSLSHL